MNEYINKEKFKRETISALYFRSEADFRRVCKAIDEEQAADISQIMHDHITSIAEGLPPTPGYYLCFWKGENHPDGTWDVLNFDGEKFLWESLFPWQNNKVTHWLPLPKDQKGGDR